MASHSEEGGEAREIRERAALVDAFSRIAPERGVAGLDGAQVARQAGLEPEAFAMYFPTVTACLLVAHDSFFSRLVEHARVECAAELPWPERSASGLAAALQFLDETGNRARFFVVDALFTGPAVLERRRAQAEALAELLREGRREHPAAAGLPEAMEWTLVAGALARITAHLLADRSEPLADLSGELAQLLLMPYLGTEGARTLATRLF